MPSATPADILARRRQLTMDGDADGLAELYSLDAVIELPFAWPSDTPMRLTGRDAIREYAQRITASPMRLDSYEVAELYQTQNPEVVIVEMRGKATMTATGRSFTTTSIQILEIRDGQIVLFRDYANPRVLEDLLGETHQ
ncbi:nuclear transport factor 2 family protein [Nocardia tengchongensis]|uniref:nuclear transport factor 2 family protein n=1 Tax=Nocardia tengchongensis TaxID=2055889 RepID=UPI0036A75768